MDAAREMQNVTFGMVRGAAAGMLQGAVLGAAGRDGDLGIFC